MHDPRTSPALRTLADLTDTPVARRWTWSIRRLDAAGRLCLGTAATNALRSSPLSVRWHHLALVVTIEAGGGRDHHVLDDQGRLLVPVWLRERGRDVVVGLDRAAPALLIASAQVLDRLGDVLTGGPR